MALAARNKDKRTHEWKRKTTYTIWYGVIQRCYNPLHASYSDYGGRGIRVHEQWLYSPFSEERRSTQLAFSNFVKDVGLRPNQWQSLDRYPDVDGPYGPGNVRWANDAQQARNKRTTLYIDDPDNPGTMIPVADYAQRHQINYHTLRYRLIIAGKWPGNT